MALRDRYPTPISKQVASSRRALSAFSQFAALAGDGLLETIYPTRCAVCDKPGYLICDTCLQSLTYIDTWKACARCGSAFGFRECTECNPVSLKQFGIETLPFDTCRNAIMYDKAAKRIIRAYKDQGEQRLAFPMAQIMARQLSPEVRRSLDFITYIPATKAAIRRRGFDHGLLLANRLGEEMCLAVKQTLLRPNAFDQRALNIHERRENLAGAFHALRPVPIRGKTVLLIDDVMTTGSTIIDASRALRDSGAATIHVVTFAHA